MRGIGVLLATLLVVWASGAQTQRTTTVTGFPNTVWVRLWYAHPAVKLKITAEPGQAKYRKCTKCAETSFVVLSLSAVGSQLEVEGDKATVAELHVSGIYQLGTASNPSLRADFPIAVRATNGKLQITAVMLMDEYIAGVLAGETGNFKSEETLKAMAVTART